MDTQTNSILVAEDLRKTYGFRKALRGLTFSLRGGRVLGFLGPNGAGKTTSIRILTTMMEPDSGRFTVAGIDYKNPKDIRRRIGVLPESLGFPRQITGVEYLTYFGRLYGLSAESSREIAKSLLREVGLEQRGKSLIGTYSHGMRQRIGIARALVNTPVVIFLDEPTLGLDPRGQQELLSLIQRIARERNTGVVLCSHSLSEIEGICDDVVIMSSGSVVAQGEVQEILGKGNKNAFRLQVPPESTEAATTELEKLSSVAKVSPNSNSPGWLNLEVTAAGNGSADSTYRDNNPLLQALIAANIPILTFEPAGNRLQDVFLQLTEEAIK